MEPRGLEPLTPCLQSDGVDLAKRRSRALSAGEPRCTALSSGDTAVLCCCTGSLPEALAQIVGLVGRPGLASADRAATTQVGVEYELPKLIATVFDHSLARWFSLGETRIRPSEVAFGTIIPSFSR